MRHPWTRCVLSLCLTSSPLLCVYFFSVQHHCPLFHPPPPTRMSSSPKAVPPLSILLLASCLVRLVLLCPLTAGLHRFLFLCHAWFRGLGMLSTWLGWQSSEDLCTRPNSLEASMSYAARDLGKAVHQETNQPRASLLTWAK